MTKSEAIAVFRLRALIEKKPFGKPELDDLHKRWYGDLSREASLYLRKVYRVVEMEKRGVNHEKD